MLRQQLLRPLMGAVKIVMKVTKSAFSWLYTEWSPHLCAAMALTAQEKGTLLRVSKNLVKVQSPSSVGSAAKF